ncbi:SipW-dependent-type signal peptide-containing protein [Natronococcus sp. A-GB1]|uniref:SipW-dependent-type signal peptide-containing protein n=1 Tax=Natronococcus sp. A-GB1 TaxID=3037648 RepID=UPI00241EF3DD|nr:SipW-dependent-type signal peptide-containing protein [Natronococcus sp. A-GB1]MDG5759186.1 SipW-dependent-type signal peptide-containing protein [Natronococcus sp. A-GB1]
MSKKNLEISRRKALAGFGVVGVASAGAGLGTTAYFSDQEEFDENTITAGEFGLTVDPFGHEVLQDKEDQHIDWNTDAGDTDDGAFISGEIGIGDAKPGDEYKFCWKVTVHDNPGYVLVRADNIKDRDGSETDAELDADDLHDTEDLATLGETADATVRVYQPGGPDAGSLSVVDYNTLNDLLDSLDEGLVIASNDEDPLSIGPEPASFPYVVVCIYISVGRRKDGSTSIGNEIQGAELSADLEFYAEQSRHNDEFGES